MHRTLDQRRYLIPFRSALLPQIFADVLVIGGGAAGMRAAMAAAEHSDVILACKGELRHSNTYWAQGGVAAVVPGFTRKDEEDSVDQHVADTLTAGAGLCEERIVRSVVGAGADMMHELIEWGLPVDRIDGSGEISLGREGGHQAHRVFHVDGDATGKAISETLDRKVREHERIRLFDNCFVLDLVTLEGGSPHCVGAITHHPKYGLQVIWAQATILASGGCGKVYRESTNPRAATGDGIAMAYRAGAQTADMAFMQFHPTTLYVAGASRLLITEAVRGEGAYLVDNQGHRFMPEYHEMAELAPRDIVSRAILAQTVKSHHTHVYLDCRHLGDRFAERFPSIHKELAQFDIDPRDGLIPVYPSAHYMIGGVYTDACGRTNVRGLYAAGEVACTRLHGANRLASNSLLEGLVLGKIAGETCKEEIAPTPTGPARIVSDIRISERAELDLADVRSSLRSVMWRQVGIERTGERLAEVIDMFDFWARYTLDKIFDDREGWEVQNQLLVGALITTAALWREESRGTHFRLDYPDVSDTYACHELWQRGSDEPQCVRLGQ
jgi:L-aspartate oxidase